MCNLKSFGWWQANAAFYTYLNSQNKSLNNGAVFGEGRVSDVHCIREQMNCFAEQEKAFLELLVLRLSIKTPMQSILI